jgi:hypothetical protein
MQTPSIDNTFDTFSELAAYHISMLKTDPQTEQMTEDFMAVFNNLKAKHDEYTNLASQNVTNLALRDRADMVLDKTLSRFNYRILEFVSGNRKSPVYRQIFPKGLRAIVSAPFDREVAMTTELVQTAGKVEIPGELNSLISEISGATETLNQKLGNYKEGLIKKTNASLEVEIAKEDFIRQYRGNYGTIMSLYPNDKKELEIFFKRFRTNTKKNPTE